MSKAICILIDKKGKTIGARLEIDGKNGNFNTETLLKIAESVKLSNAIIDKNGFIRGKAGVTLRKVIFNTLPNAIEQREQAAAHKLSSSGKLLVYHGTKASGLIPRFGVGKIDNDYGQGFYTTPNKELGKEWAWGTYTKGEKGYLYTYEIDTTGLAICDLTKLDSLHWMAELFHNRTFNVDENESAFIDGKNQFINLYKLDLSGYDIVIGYRADDSYFKYAEDFIFGIIYREIIDNALRFGDLGLQVFIKSPKAFSRLKQVYVEEVPKIYEAKYKKRDEQARKKYIEARRNKESARVKQRFTDFI